jgi:hypothetical protein
MSGPSPGDVIAGYLKLREQKEALADKHREEMAPISSRMTQLENFMLKLLQDANLSSMAFKGVGTMFKKETSSCKVQEWDAILDWIRANEAWEFLEKRVSKTVVEEYSQAHGELPPGVEVSFTTVVQVRKG